MNLAFASAIPVDAWAEADVEPAGGDVVGMAIARGFTSNTHAISITRLPSPHQSLNAYNILHALT